MCAVGLAAAVKGSARRGLWVAGEVRSRRVTQAIIGGGQSRGMWVGGVGAGRRGDGETSQRRRAASRPPAGDGPCLGRGKSLSEEEQIALAWLAGWRAGWVSLRCNTQQ